MTHSLTSLLTGLGPAALAVSMLIVFAETGLLAGFFLPGDTLLLTLGALIAAGKLHLGIEFAVPLIAIAAMAGDQFAYYLGRRNGHRIFSRPSSKILNPNHIVRANTFFERHGTKTIAVARFVPIVRTLAPLIAGIGSMPHRKFTILDTIGALTWTSLMLGVGYFSGSIPFVANNLEYFIAALFAISLTPAVVAWIVNRRRQSPATQS